MDFNRALKPELLLVLIDALQIAAATAMMSNAGDVRAELDRAISALGEFSPLPRRGRREGYEWLRACRDARSCGVHGAYLSEERGRWGSPARVHLDVVIDGTVHRVIEDGDRDAIVAAIPEVREWIRDFAPMDAEPLAIFAGTVVLPTPVEIERTSHGYRRLSDERRELAPVSIVLSEHLSTVTGYVHVVDARPSYRADNAFEMVVGVPRSRCAAAIDFVRSANEAVGRTFAVEGDGLVHEAAMSPTP